MLALALVARSRPHPSPTPFGRRARAYRVDAGLTRIQLAEEVGIQYAALRQWEVSAKANPTLATITKPADALGCTPDDLMGYGGSSPEGNEDGQ
jgi:transcriptional regulator with XRE-family HTH domain